MMDDREKEKALTDPRKLNSKCMPRWMPRSHLMQNVTEGGVGLGLEKVTK